MRVLSKCATMAIVLGAILAAVGDDSMKPIAWTLVGAGFISIYLIAAFVLWPDMKSRVLSLLNTVVQIVIYLYIGWVVYSKHGIDDVWSYIYYGVVTCTTVGYGDHGPSAAG